MKAVSQHPSPQQVVTSQLEALHPNESGRVAGVRVKRLPDELYSPREGGRLRERPRWSVDGSDPLLLFMAVDRVLRLASRVAPTAPEAPEQDERYGDVEWL